MNEASGSPRRGREFLAIALLVLLPVGAYLPALGAGFIWDDDDYVTNNPTLHEPGGLARIWGELSAILCPTTVPHCPALSATKASCTA